MKQQRDPSSGAPHGGVWNRVLVISTPGVLREVTAAPGCRDSERSRRGWSRFRGALGRHFKWPQAERLRKAAEGSVAQEHARHDRHERDSQRVLCRYRRQGQDPDRRGETDQNCPSTGRPSQIRAVALHDHDRQEPDCR